MIKIRPKLWTSVSAAILLAACSPGGEGGETADGAAPAVGEGGEAAEQGANAVPPAAVGEGGEAGELGAAQAYGSVPAQSKAALRLAHLKGFFLIAQAQTEGADAAAALAGQGMLEVFDKDPAAFKAAGVDENLLRKAAGSGSAADLKAAIAHLDGALAKAGGDPAAVVKGMTGIASGLYQGVVKDGDVDSIEYQHSLGAVLSARDIAAKDAGKTAKLAAAKPELEKLVKLWPATSAPKTPTPAGEVLSQASRVELALS